MAKNDLQGTLDLLVLKTLLQTGKLHGYGIVVHIQRASDDLLSVEEGSLYPALHRMEQSGLIASEWALTETNRKAKYYRLARPAKSICSRRKRTSKTWSRACAQSCAMREEGCHVVDTAYCEPVLTRRCRPGD